MAGRGHSIDCTTLQQTIERLELYCERLGVPFMTIWNGGTLKYGEYTDSLDANKNSLIANIMALHQSGTTASFQIRFHPVLDTDGYISDKTKYIGSIDFKLHDGNPYKMGEVSAPNNPVMEQILQLMKRQDERITDLESVEDDVMTPVDEGNDIVAQIDRITGVIERNPVLGGFLDDVRFGMRHLMKKAGVTFDRPNIENRVSGTTQQNSEVMEDVKEKITYSLKVLIPIFTELPDILVKLAQIAQRDRADFDFYKKKLVDAANKME